MGVRPISLSNSYNVASANPAGSGGSSKNTVPIQTVTRFVDRFREFAPNQIDAIKASADWRSAIANYESDPFPLFKQAGRAYAEALFKATRAGDVKEKQALDVLNASHRDVKNDKTAELAYRARYKELDSGAPDATGSTSVIAADHVDKKALPGSNSTDVATAGSTSATPVATTSPVPVPSPSNPETASTDPANSTASQKIDDELKAKMNQAYQLALDGAKLSDQTKKARLEEFARALASFDPNASLSAPGGASKALLESAFRSAGSDIKASMALALANNYKRPDGGEGINFGIGAVADVNKAVSSGGNGATPPAKPTTTPQKAEDRKSGEPVYSPVDLNQAHPYHDYNSVAQGI
jgi:hypothetical protein